MQRRGHLSLECEVTIGPEEFAGDSIPGGVGGPTTYVQLETWNLSFSNVVGALSTLAWPTNQLDSALGKDVLDGENHGTIVV